MSEASIRMGAMPKSGILLSRVSMLPAVNEEAGRKMSSGEPMSTRMPSVWSRSKPARSMLPCWLSHRRTPSRQTAVCAAPRPRTDTVFSPPTPP